MDMTVLCDRCGAIESIRCICHDVCTSGENGDACDGDNEDCYICSLDLYSNEHSGCCVDGETGLPCGLESCYECMTTVIYDQM